MRREMPPETPRTRQVVAAAITLVVLGGIGAIKAGSAGASFMEDLELAQPPLARHAPTIVDAHVPRLADRVFVVIIDGLRLDRSYELPFLDSLRRRGVDGEAQSQYPTWSRPNYVSILTGVPPTASGVRTNHHTMPVMLDSLMDRARAAHLADAIVTDYGLIPQLFLRPINPTDAFPPLDIEGIEDSLSPLAVHSPEARFATPFDDARYVPWPGGFSEAGSALVKGDAPLVVMLISVVDAAGHAHGADSPDYRAAAEIADRALAGVLGHVDLERDAIIITADHGHTGRGGHGGIEPEVLSVPLVMAGAGVEPGATPNDARLIDLAPTAAALLGMPAPGHGLGRTLVEVLHEDAGAKAQLLAADHARLAVTQSTVTAADARASAALLEDRAWRLAAVGGGALAAIALALLLIRRRVLRLDVRVLLVSVPAFFIVYYALIGTLGQRFSPSLLPEKGHLAGQMIKYGVAAMVAQLAASLWALRNQGNLAQRLAAANGSAWMGLMLTMLPAGLLWAFFPAPYLIVPGPLWLVLIPAVQVAVACAAIDAVLILCIEVIVFAARAWHRDGMALH
ncbi:MAG: alkaline phosphatase family protein [Acidobacteriota bacterium]